MSASERVVVTAVHILNGPSYVRVPGVPFEVFEAELVSNSIVDVRPGQRSSGVAVKDGSLPLRFYAWCHVCLLEQEVVS